MMQKKEKEITDRNEIDDILKKNTVCRIALSDNNKPYMIPVSYGYDDEKIYIHCAQEGRKLDIIKKNRHVCFEVSDNIGLVGGESACQYTARFRSVIGFGEIEIVIDRERIRKGLNIIMRQHTGKEEWDYKEKILGHTGMLVIRIHSVSGKKAGMK